MLLGVDSLRGGLAEGNRISLPKFRVTPQVPKVHLPTFMQRLCLPQFQQASENTSDLSRVFVARITLFVTFCNKGVIRE